MRCRFHDTQRDYEPTSTIKEEVSSSHDVDRENAALMTCEQVIDEVATDRIGLVAKFGNDATNQRSTSTVPFEIDRAMCGFAVNLGPAMRAAWALVLGGNQIKAAKLGIVHDFFP